MTIPLPFENLNESDIREEILAPLIRQLGYRSGTSNNVIREQSLRYPMQFLGRKDPQKDPALRGKADYILEVQQRVRWVIEAKAPEVPVGLDEIEQAWTYASHPEVRAVFFLLCNGRVLLVYRTVHGPEAPPVLSLTYEQLEQDFQVLWNLLSPEALLRDFPDVQIDVGVPIIGLIERSKYFFAHGFGLGRGVPGYLAQPFQHHHEFVAPQARHGVALSHAGRKALGDLL